MEDSCYRDSSGSPDAHTLVHLNAPPAQPFPGHGHVSLSVRLRDEGRGLERPPTPPHPTLPWNRKEAAGTYTSGPPGCLCWTARFRLEFHPTIAQPTRPGFPTAMRSERIVRAMQQGACDRGASGSRPSTRHVEQLHGTATWNGHMEEAGPQKTGERLRKTPQIKR